MCKENSLRKDCLLRRESRREEHREREKCRDKGKVQGGERLRSLKGKPLKGNRDKGNSWILHKNFYISPSVTARGCSTRKCYSTKHNVLTHHSEEETCTHIHLIALVSFSESTKFSAAVSHCSLNRRENIKNCVQNNWHPKSENTEWISDDLSLAK